MKLPGGQTNQQAAKGSTSTQESLRISEIRDGVVIMRDGSLRAVVLGSAINFDLMSQQEQDGIELAFQSFLNSLHFPIQIVVRSQRLDLDSYIDGLKKQQQALDNQLLSNLMEDYIANIKGLIEEVNIMDKQFYVVVPFFPPIHTKEGFVSSVKGILGPQQAISVGETEFLQYKTELSQRIQLVSSGLSQMGVRAIPLATQELVDLYYTSYNPDVAVNQKLVETQGVQGAVVTKSDKPPAPRGTV